MTDFEFLFVNDTKQGSLLQYRRPKGNLDSNEQCDLVVSNWGYAHFTCKDSNFQKSGDESNANNIDGTGYLTFFNDEGVQETYPIVRFTYYTNGSVKECFFKLGMKAHTFTIYKP